MISITRRPMPVASFADMGLFAVFCAGSMLLAVSIQLGPYGVSTRSAVLPALAFAFITTAIGTMFGLFRGGERKTLAVVFARTLLALAIAAPAASQQSALRTRSTLRKGTISLSRGARC